MSEDVTLAALAGKAYDWFETAERYGESFVRTKEGAPEWVGELVRYAHGDMLPDDWRYKTIRSALGAIHDAADGDADDLAFEFADRNVDAYTGARLAWLASNLNRASYCDDAAEEGLAAPDAGIVERIGIGQYEESREVFGLVLESLRERLEGLEGEQD